MASNETDGLGVPQMVPNEKLSDEIDLYIGVFFDGTNNNKYQVMLGKMFRRQAIFDRVKEQLGKVGITSPNQMTERPRSFWEQGKGAGILTSSEIDYLYFGYGDVNHTTSNEYNTFIEEKSATALDYDENDSNSTSLTSRPDLKKHRNKLQGLASQMANRSNVNADEYKNWKGTGSQKVTYTNVAILESLYECNYSETQRHLSIYVEGSGTDMQLGMDNDIAHKVTYLLAGLALGTGPTGVVAKVRKVSTMVNRFLRAQTNPTKTVIAKLHFDVYGFSRGATAARIFTYLVNPNPQNEKKSYDGDDSIVHHIDDMEQFTRSTTEFLKINEETKGSLKIQSKEVRNLGIFDTVSSIGVKNNGIISYLLTKQLVDCLEDIIDPIDLHINDTIKDTIISKEKEKITERFNSAIKEILQMSIGKKVLDVVVQKVGLLVNLVKLVKTGIKYHLTAKTLVDKLHGNPIAELKDLFSSLSLNPYQREDIERSSKWKRMVMGVLEDIRMIIEYGKPVDKNTGDISVQAKRPFHYQNVDDYGLWATCLAKRVFHICAMDEIRQNFALVDISSSIGLNGTEVFIPGCHTDIGGGAAIEKEEEVVVNKRNYLLLGKKFLPRFNMHDKSVLLKQDECVSINVEGMKKLGWLSKVDVIKEKDWKGRIKTPIEEYGNYATDNFSKLVVYRHVRPGYSNISLKLMRDKCGGEIFKQIPCSYAVPSVLSDFQRHIEGNVREGKRCFVYPQSAEEYRILRNTYLHLSFNDRLNDKADNILVNGPEFGDIDSKALFFNTSKSVGSRIIYEGNPHKEREQPLHMFDYGNTVISTI